MTQRQLAYYYYYYYYYNELYSSISCIAPLVAFHTFILHCLISAFCVQFWYDK